MVNDELLEVCVTKNVEKELCSEEIAKEKSVENLREKGVDLSSKFRTQLRSKLEAEISPNLVLDPLEDSELVVIAESVSREKIQLIIEEHISEGEKFIEIRNGRTYPRIILYKQTKLC